MKYLRQILPVFVFGVILFGLTTVSLTTEEKSYSASERRELQTRPKLTKKTIKNGKFQEKYETYLSDQFPGRDSWVQLQTNTSRLLGKKESNGVYFAKDDYLLEHYGEEDFSGKQAQKNRKALAKFVKKTKEQMNVRVMIVPTKTAILKEKLPAFAPVYDEQNFYRKLEEQLGDLSKEVLIPVTDELQAHKSEDIYYRTDHHWTTLGAWYGYSAYLKAVGDDRGQAIAKKELQLADSNFYGTTYAKVRQASRPDSIYLYEPTQQLTVVYNMGEKTTDTLYEMDNLTSKDPYSVFTGGNQPVLEITGGSKNGKVLMVIKDSFANCMVPFLAEDYEKLIVLDLRQLNARCSKLIEMFAPTDLLILYNSAQFAKDRDFAMKCK